MDIKPISKGHVIIIPKNPCPSSKDLPDKTFILAKEISKKLISNLKAKGTEIQTQFSFGETIINIIPIYDESLNLNSPRTEISEKELSEILQKLKTEKPKPIKKKPTKIIKLKRKIP